METYTVEEFELITERTPQQAAHEIREWLAWLARTHPDFTTEDMILMQPTMTRLRELGREE